MAKQFDMSDYVDVAARIGIFRDKYPEGSLQPANLDKPYTIEQIDGTTYIVVVAAAYRTADDQRPGVGMAYEVFPGKTPYTRNSELMNAETSAHGRAIVAALAADTKKGIASAEEVRNRSEEQAAPVQNDPLTVAKGLVWKLAQGKGMDRQALSDDYTSWSQGVPLGDATAEDLTSYAGTLK